VALVWKMGSRRFSVRLLAASASGLALYLLTRWQLALPLPDSSPHPGLLGAAGGALRRYTVLLLDPRAADVMPQLEPSSTLGVVAVALAVVLLLLSWGRPAVAGFAAVGLILVPSVMASAHLDLIADRYLYVALGPLSLLAVTALRRGRFPLWLWLLPLGLGVFTGLRAADWRSDRGVFAASLERTPDNPYAAFHLAYDLHVRHGDCAGAIPYYERGLEVDARAATNLLACLVETGGSAEAAERGPAFFEAHPDRAPLAVNTARAMVAEGRLVEAERWCLKAIELEPERCDLRVMLGNLQGQLGRLADAEASFSAGLELGSGCEAEARQGLETVARLRAQAVP
jgi:hypothetical protein